MLTSSLETGELLFDNFNEKVHMLEGDGGAGAILLGNDMLDLEVIISRGGDMASSSGEYEPSWMNEELEKY